MDKTPDEAAESLAARSCQTYREHRERAALRCALGDAAALCDALARAIEKDHRTRNGKGPVSKLGKLRASVAKACGDQIFAMRDRIA